MLKIIIFLFLFSFTVQAGEGNLSLNCPPFIKTYQEINSNNNQGSFYINKLNNIYFSDGPPENNKYIVRYQSQKQKIFSLYQWDVLNSSNYWLSCHYSDTNIFIGMQVSSSSKHCFVQYKNNILIGNNAWCN